MSNIVMAAGGDDGYQISRSVRLRASATAYFNRTPASAGNRKTWTWSGWVKRGKLNNGSGTQYVFSCTYGANDASFMEIYFPADDSLALAGYSANYRQTTQVFRDPSAWYHIVVTFDTTQATGANRVKLYVNGSQITSFSASTDPTLNTDYPINNSQAHYIGCWSTGTPTAPFDGYLTEINFIDGQALTPSSFGQTDPVTGVWGAKKYAGTYGTNGFYLNFSDPSAATAAAIGKDSSGNGNNWTPNNISVTAGVTYDSMLDTPTPYADGGNGRGNYAVLNPLGVDSPSSTTANGNLTLSNSASNQKRATIPVVASDTNKYYWEVTVNGTATGNFPNMGMFVVGSGTNWVGYDGNSIGLYQGGGLYYNGSLVATLTSFASGDVIGIAYDPVTGKIWFAKNGTWMASGVPSTGASPNYTLPTGVDRVAGGYTGSGYGTLEFNFGQRPFAYTPPTGFKALNTQNLPDATIKAGNKYMDVSTWTGDGTSSRAIANSGGFQPDLVWTKARSGASNLSHLLVDSVRGAPLILSSDQTSAESSLATGVTAFNSNGFQIGTWPNVNGSAEVGWQWKAGGSAVTNTAGSITSSVSANLSSGFSVVGFTNVPVVASPYTIGHGLGVAPKFYIVKNRDFVDDFYCYHASLGATYRISLNTTAAAAGPTTTWASTAPTSTVFSLQGNTLGTSTSQRYVAYCFSEVAGFSKFGSYTGNGSTDGPFVYCGFRPKWLLLKVSSAAGYGWLLYDSSRNTYNVTDLNLRPHLSDAEGAQPANNLDFLSNGFKIRGDSTGSINPAQTIIYAAFAENPFKNSLAR